MLNYSVAELRFIKAFSNMHATLQKFVQTSLRISIKQPNVHE